MTEINLHGLVSEQFLIRVTNVDLRYSLACLPASQLPHNVLVGFIQVEEAKSDKGASLYETLS